MRQHSALSSVCRHSSVLSLLHLLCLLHLSDARDCQWGDVSKTTNGVVHPDFEQLTRTGCTSLFLDGSQQKIGDEGAYELANVLRNSDVAVTKIVLVNQGIQVAGAAELAEMLKTNTHLTELDLGENEIQEAGTNVFAEALFENYVLTALFAKTNDEGAAVLLSALECNEKFANKPAAERKHNAKLCKQDELKRHLSKPHVQTSISQAVQGQAALETRAHQLRLKRQAGGNQSPTTTQSPIVSGPQPSVQPATGPAVQSSAPPTKSAPADCVDKYDQCNTWAKAGECKSNPPFMKTNCPKACKICGGAPATSTQATGAANTAQPSQQTPPAATANKTPATADHGAVGAAADTAALQTWLAQHKLTEKVHLPILNALGVKRVAGRAGSLQPLRMLSFADLSSELSSFKSTLPCSPHCSADFAAVYQALQEDKDKPELP